MPLQAPAFAWRPASQRDSQDDVVVGEGNGAEAPRALNVFAGLLAVGSGAKQPPPEMP